MRIHISSSTCAAAASEAFDRRTMTTMTTLPLSRRHRRRPLVAYPGPTSCLSLPLPGLVSVSARRSCIEEKEEEEY